MKLTKSQLLLISFMLFSLFFGAGNLIFPPLLGQQAASKSLFATIGFLITAVVLPILGVIVVGKFDGLTNLGNKVGKRFALVFTLLIYLSIGPGLGIPRAGSVPFEMAITPILPKNCNLTLWMFIYTSIFFAIVLWLCLTPGKLVKRIGTILTPSLLGLILILFIVFLFKSPKVVNTPLNIYANNAFLQGFVDGYQTMDTIAALNFGLVMVITLNNFGIKHKKDIIKYTIFSGIIAGIILALVYIMLSVIGTYTSGFYPADPNGALILRRIASELFGEAGAFLIAGIFTLACLTTCIGLTNSISQYFATFFKKVSYTKWVIIITILSFLICNLGLNAILKISIPILNAIYPVSIALIVLGLTDQYLKNNRFIYRLVIYSTFVISIINALEGLNINLGFITKILSFIPLYNKGFGWVVVAIFMAILSIILNKIFPNKKLSRE